MFFEAGFLLLRLCNLPFSEWGAGTAPILEIKFEKNLLHIPVKGTNFKIIL